MLWKWILGILTALVVVVTLTIYIVLLNYDFNTFKPLIVQTVKDMTGRELTLAGDIRLKIGPAPALTTEGAGFQNASWGSRPQMVKVRRLEVQIALLQLVVGNVRIKQLNLIEPDILIETDRSGRSNLKFRPPQKTEKRSFAIEKYILPRISFGKISILNANVTFNSGRTGRKYHLSIKRLVAERAKEESRLKLGLEGAYRGRSIKASGTSGLFSAAIDPQSVWPLNVKTRIGQETVTLEGTVKDVFNGKGLDLTLAANGRSILSLAEFAEIKGLPDLGPYRAKLRMTDPGGEFTIKSFEAAIGSLSLVKLDLKGTVAAPLKKKGLHLDFKLQGNDLAHLKKITGRPLPLKGPFRLSGQARDLAPRAYKIDDLTAAFGKSRIKGSLSVDWSGRKPELKGFLSSKKLDLRALLGKEKKPARKRKKTSGRTRAGKVFSDKKIPFDAVFIADAAIKLQAAECVLPRMVLKDLTLDLSIQKRRLTVKSLRAQVGGGSLYAGLDLKMRKKSASIRLAVKGGRVNLRQVLNELGNKQVVSGMLDLDLELWARGNSLARLMAGLNGKILAKMGAGRIRNKTIALVGGGLTAGLFRRLNPSNKNRDFTNINCLVSRFDIKNGLAEASALVVETPAMVVGGRGRIDLRAEKLDLLLDLSPKKGVAGLSMGLTELAQSFRLRGTLADPDFGVDTADATFTFGKAIGGVVLFGPAGILAALTGKSSGGDNPCQAALAAAEKKIKAEKKKRSKKKKNVVEKTSERIKDTFKKLFNR